MKVCSMAERDTVLSGDMETRIAKNKKYLASLGIEFSIFEPTITGLGKSILDATRPVRSHFESEGFHSFDQQGQGVGNKVIKIAHFVTNHDIICTKVSLYRPETKQGDPRMWFSGLGNFAKPKEQIAIVVFEDELYLFNFSCIFLDNLVQGSKAAEFIARYYKSKNSIAEELLEKLKEIAKSPIKSTVKGDTAVGMAVEGALNIAANCDKKPDYKGIELKAGRGVTDRTTLFAQVADWRISECKSSKAILDNYGYRDSDDVFRLYCTVSARNVNSQGLYFSYDEASDQLIEKDRDGTNVAIWPGELLRKRLLQKHAETFWIQAASIMINGIEHFELISVTHTKQPLESQFLPLVGSGVITMDHLIKRELGSLRVSEKGPLFKINKRNLALLFPEPKTYSLR